MNELEKYNNQDIFNPESREINHMLHFFIKSSFLPIDIL